LPPGHIGYAAEVAQNKRNAEVLNLRDALKDRLGHDE
jgi:hypothetical protein